MTQCSMQAMPVLFTLLRSANHLMPEALLRAGHAGAVCGAALGGAPKPLKPCSAQVMPVLFAVLRSADDALREFLVQQLTALVALLRANMRKWLPDTLALAAELWSQAAPAPQLLPHLLKLISELAGAHALPQLPQPHPGPSYFLCGRHCCWTLVRRSVYCVICTLSCMVHMSSMLRNVVCCWSTYASLFTALVHSSASPGVFLKARP